MLGKVIAGLIRGARSGRGAPVDAPGSRELAQASELIAAGSHERAEALLHELTRALPDSAEVYRTLGSLLGMLGKLSEARVALERAAVLDPSHPACLADLGNIHRLQGRLPDAEACYRRSLALDPQNRTIRFNLALLELETARKPEAMRSLAALLAPPAHAESLKTLVKLLDEDGQIVQAVETCERVLASEPDHPAAHAALGFLLLKRVLDPETALMHLDRALAASPADAELRANRAIALQDLGRMDEALADYDAAFALDGSMHAVRFHRALGLLLLGRYGEAWPDYELRHLGEDRGSAPVERARWQGQDLSGKSLLVYGEQGIGDEIMFASCIPDVMRACPRVVIACAPKLAPLFQRSFPQAECVPVAASASAQDNVRIPPTDLMVPIGSLPSYFRRRVEEFPRHTGYLRAEPNLVREYAERLHALGEEPKVGIAWRGGTVKSRQALRTLPMDALADLINVPGVRFVNLQYDSSGAEPELAAALAAGRLQHWPDALADYDRTAALVCALDLVVSVCTAVIHLAGALGKPVWVMAPHVPEWRYCLHGESMPWYPSARVFRPPSRGDWGIVTRAIAAQLRAMSQR